MHRVGVLVTPVLVSLEPSLGTSHAVGKEWDLAGAACVED